MSSKYTSYITPVDENYEPRQAGKDWHGGNGGGTTGDMDARVTRLETHMEYVRADLSEIKSGQKETAKALVSLASNLDKLPTRSDLWAWKLTWLAIALVGFATIVGGIIGGLDWIKTH